ncbi:MAG: PRC-barrel domain-containing protein [Anaerolineales bacterium]|nr:PRC-barrel domain-containing protein [Anaerolineales bacterium]
MDIKLNAPVECLDGKRSGHVTGIIVNPENDKLTHLVIKTKGVERIVPVALIRDATPEVVLLTCTVTRLNEQQPLVETEYVRSVVEHYDFGPAFIDPDAKPRYGPETYAVKHEHIPNGDLKIKRGTPVFAKDGHIGHVDDVGVDPVNDHITHIVLREGHLWGAKEVVIGIEHVKSVEDDGIYLKSTKAQVSQFQSSPVNTNPAANQGGNSMDISVHALVHCTDGDFGPTTCLIVNPVNDNITHFVVKDHHLLGVEHIVPVSFITSATADRITVNCDCATLAHQPDFIEYEYDRFDELMPYREGYTYWPMMLPDDTLMYTSPEYFPIEHEQIPAGELAVRRGMTVYVAATNEGGATADRIRIGEVEAFVADPTTGHITHLILREGRLWGQRDVTIPVNAIEKIEVDDVQLTLTKQEVEALPSVPVKRWAPFAR